MRERVEDMEVRLKQDILAEARLFGNQILVVHENTDLTLYDHWEPVTVADVQTPQEVYAELKGENKSVARLGLHIIVNDSRDGIGIFCLFEMIFKSLTFMFVADGYDVDYLRIPVTDEKAPKDQDFEELINRLWTVPPDAAMIFNCQVEAWDELACTSLTHSPMSPYSLYQANYPDFLNFRVCSPLRWAEAAPLLA